MLSKPNKFLYPLSILFKLIINIRNYLYDNSFLSTYKSKLKVICVGNATVGGSGKSPFVQYLTKELHQHGYKPVILSRGYKSNINTPHLVTDIDTAYSVGDEAMMHRLSLKNFAHVVISSNRVEGIKYIEVNNLGDLVILDDGYQHRRLARDINLLLLDTTDETSINKWNNGILLPAGYLREPLSTAITRASSIIYTSKSDNELNPLGLKDNYFNFNFYPTEFIDCLTKETINPSELGTEVSVLTSIADPRSFISSLEAKGLKINDKFIFPDHYLFKGEEFQNILTKTKQIICTEKDAIKLTGFLTEENRLFCLKLSGEFKKISQKEIFFKNISTPSDRI